MWVATGTLLPQSNKVARPDDAPAGSHRATRREQAQSGRQLELARASKVGPARMPKVPRILSAHTTGPQYRQSLAAVYMTSVDIPTRIGATLIQPVSQHQHERA